MLGLVLGAALPSVEAAAQLYGAGRNSAVTVDQSVLDSLGYPPNVPGNLGSSRLQSPARAVPAVPREPVVLQLTPPPLRMPTSRLEQTPPARQAAQARQAPARPAASSGRTNQVMSAAATAAPSQSPDPYAAVALQPKPSDPLVAAHTPAPAPAPAAAPVDPSASVGDQLRQSTPAAAPAAQQVAAVAPPAAPAAPAAATPAPAVAVPAPAEPAPAPAPAIAEKVDFSVLFEANSSQLTDAGKQSLQQFAAGALGGNGRIELRAYAAGSDEQATQARRLSLARALAVRSFLTQQGFATTRVDVRALGNQGGAANADRVDLQVINS
ncbi:OmpA family protein [Lacibacterium aquatile]|uniref:OmpA family protein n=1 Tax=Lacibacterium aquatile TaxID=1168082 RepID=A0ABW5DSA9_9PROT